MLQWYFAVLSLLTVNVADSPPAIEPVSNDWSSAVIVCAVSSAFFTVTVVPAFTVSVAGTNMKLRIVISAFAGAADASDLSLEPHAPSTAASARTATMHATKRRARAGDGLEVFMRDVYGPGGADG